MAFIESPRFFDSFSLGSSFGPEYSTSIVRTINGKEYRKQRRGVPVYMFSLGAGVDSPAKLDELRAQHNACLGRLTGFRIKDHTDWTSAANMITAIADTDQTLGTGDTVETDFQLVKIYTVGSESLTRTIKKPVSGTVVVSLDDVSQGAGWTVDTTTGIVTFSVAPGGGVVVKAGFEFDVPVRFDSDQLQVQKLDPYNEVASIGLIEDLNA